MGDVNGDWAPAGPVRPESLAAPTKDSVNASVPSTSAPHSSQVSVPFRIDNLKGKSITSYQFDIEYDPNIIAPAKIAAEISGTLSENLSIVSNSPEPGLLKVAVYGAISAQGDGVYVKLKFDTIAKPGNVSPLRITEFRFNEGVDSVFMQEGQIKITEETKTIGGKEISANRRAMITSWFGMGKPNLASLWTLFE